MLGGKSTLITLIESESLYFILPGDKATAGLLNKINLDGFLDPNLDTPGLLPETRRMENGLLVIPDYWLGNSSVAFQSRKKPLVESFIERKLRAEHSDFREAEEYYGYKFYKESERSHKLYVFFPQDPLAYSLFHKLSAVGLAPLRITSPAYLWQEKLSDLYEDFPQGGKCLIHLETSACHLYLFYLGQFLFSRKIILSRTDGDVLETVNQLNYEINQSFYLFSQKSKTGVDGLYLLSEQIELLTPLQESLGRDLTPLEKSETRDLSNLLNQEELGTLSGFSLGNMSPKGGYLSLTHKPLKNELEWKPVQHSGIAVGIFLLLLLLGELFFIKIYPGPDFFDASAGKLRAIGNPKQVLQEYAEALDAVTENRLRPSPAKWTFDLAASVPDEVVLKKATFETESEPGIMVEAVIPAPGPKHFKKYLSEFVQNLNQRFKPPEPLMEKDVAISPDEASSEITEKQYRVKFRISL